MVEVTEYDMTEFVSISDKGFQSLWPSIQHLWDSSVPIPVTSGTSCLTCIDS